MKIIKITLVLVLLFTVALMAWRFSSSQTATTDNLANETSQVSQLPETEDVHLHAGFQVYDNGELVDFAVQEYMHIKPCTMDQHSESLSPDELQLEKAHLHDMVGDVVHVHKKGAVWGDLFSNINYPIPSESVGYIDGELAENFLQTPIVSKSSLVVFIGEPANTAELLENAVSAEYIEEVETTSVECS